MRVRGLGFFSCRMFLSHGYRQQVGQPGIAHAHRLPPRWPVDTEVGQVGRTMRTTKKDNPDKKVGQYDIRTKEPGKSDRTIRTKELGLAYFVVRSSVLPQKTSLQGKWVRPRNDVLVWKWPLIIVPKPSWIKEILLFRNHTSSVFLLETSTKLRFLEKIITSKWGRTLSTHNNHRVFLLLPKHPDQFSVWEFARKAQLTTIFPA